MWYTIRYELLLPHTIIVVSDESHQTQRMSHNFGALKLIFLPRTPGRWFGGDLLAPARTELWIYGRDEKSSQMNSSLAGWDVKATRYIHHIPTFIHGDACRFDGDEPQLYPGGFSQTLERQNKTRQPRYIPIRTECGKKNLKSRWVCHIVKGLSQYKAKQCWQLLEIVISQWKDMHF